jgi:hypothetical protein
LCGCGIEQWLAVHQYSDFLAQLAVDRQLVRRRTGRGQAGR